MPLQHAKKSCYRSLNSIIGKIGTRESPEIILELVTKICWPILLYGLEACPITNADRRSLDFMATRLLMKLFDTGNIDIVNDCAFYFGFDMPSSILQSRTDKFRIRYQAFQSDSRTYI